MKKVISLFKRNYDGDRMVYDEIVPGSEWVVAGEGIATVKIDGTSCLVRDGKLYRRYDAKRGKKPPANFEPAQEPDAVTGHWPGWVPVGDEPESKWHREAAFEMNTLENGTYELIGPKVQGNPYSLLIHMLVKHGYWKPVSNPPLDFAGLKEWFEHHAVEGIVWHRGNGDMVKIKRSDFGFAWPDKLALLDN
jgi:hypothetical protein